MVSISTCSIDFPEVQSNPGFGSSSAPHTTEYSGSGDTDDFIREVTERHNISYSVLTKVNSEDEVSNPFSLSSSRHSLLIVDSDMEKDGSSSPEELSTPSEPKQKEARNSYSLSSCSISHTPAIVTESFEVASDPEVGTVVRSGALEHTSDEESPLSNSVTLRLPAILTRQGEVDECDGSCLTPTNVMVGDYDGVMSPSAPTPQSVVIKTDGEVSSGVCTYEPDDLEILIDEIVGESETVRERPPVPTRRHSNCDPASRGVVSLVPLFQRRTSVVTLPSFTPLLSQEPPFTRDTLLTSHNTLFPPPEDTRKLSDPAINLRKERVKNSSQYLTKQKRCLSDSEAPNFLTEDDDCKSEECESSALDSGYHDSRFQDSSSLYYPASSRVSLDNFSDDCMEPPIVSPTKLRRPTPFSPFAPKTDINNQVSWPWDESPNTNSASGTQVAPQPKRSLPSRQSQSSIATSSEGVSVGSYWESQISQLSAIDVLSSLGFDDYESPQLIPDRFIPKDVEHVKPSMMKSLTLESEDDSIMWSRAPSISTMSESSVSSSQPILRPLTMNTHDLPLGATAENFIAPGSPPPQTPQTTPLDKIPSNPPPAATSYLHRYNTVLETVPEETASDLSPSPRWLSPRVSIDHSVDVVEGKLGASLNIKARKRSLPSQREGYKLSIGSQVESETGDSIHVSVTSYDDELALEKEREKEEGMVPIPLEDCTMQRRARRKGVYVPPTSLLTWLNSQETIDEEQQNPEELPWPFSEQAKLRVSLTEIQLERIESETTNERPQSQLSDCPRLLESPVCNILDLRSRSPSVEPHGRSSLSSLGSHDLERNISPADNRSLNLRCETTLMPPKRRSRSLSPIIPPREEAIRKATCTGRLSRTTDDIQLGPAASSTVSHVRVITHEDRDYKTECTRLRSDLNSLEARTNSTENMLKAEITTLQTKLTASEKRLSRQTAIYQDLQQEFEGIQRELRETKHNHTASLAALKSEARQVYTKEREQLKDKLNKEKACSVQLIQEKHARDLSDLKKALKAKTTELQQLTILLSERTEACTALSSELKTVRKNAEGREVKLKARLEEEKSSLERSYNQEKVSSLRKLQEQYAADKQNELSALKEKLLAEKKAAISRLEQKHLDQVTKLQQQLQKARELSQKVISTLSEEAERKLADEKSKNEQAKHTIAVLRQELGRTQTKGKAEQRRLRKLSTESQRSTDESQRSILNGVLSEWIKSAEALGQRRPRAHSTGNIPVINATENALLGMKMTNDLLRQQLRELKERLEKEKMVGLSAHRDKMSELRRLKAIAQIDKHKALKALTKRMKEKYSEKEAPVGPSTQDQEQQTLDQNKETPNPTLEKELETQRAYSEKVQLLYDQKCQEVSGLKTRIKQLAKEHLLLERMVQKDVSVRDIPICLNKH